MGVVRAEGEGQEGRGSPTNQNLKPDYSVSSAVTTMSKRQCH